MEGEGGDTALFWAVVRCARAGKANLDGAACRGGGAGGDAEDSEVGPGRNAAAGALLQLLETDSNAHSFLHGLSYS